MVLPNAQGEVGPVRVGEAGAGQRGRRAQGEDASASRPSSLKTRLKVVRAENV